MPEITAAAVKELREKTGLPMMDCKQALTECNGDQEKAIEELRKKGKKVQEKQSGRSTSTGRIAIYADPASSFGAIIDLRCESASVANNEHFVALANDMAKQLATGPGAASPDALLDQPSPSQKGTTLRQQFDDLNNRIREKFVLERIKRVDGPTAGYVHHNGAVAAILQFEGADGGDLARDISMHVTALNPAHLRREDVDPAAVEKERALLDEALDLEAQKIKTEAERILAMPDQQIQDPNNLEKMTSSHGRARGDMKKAEGMLKNKAKVIEGRMGQFFGERCLLEQIHPNQAKYGTKTIAELAKAAGMTIKGFVRWELPKE
jgi:elongation factor Ts